MSWQLTFSYQQGMRRRDVPRDITSIIVPDGVTSIANCAFDNYFEEGEDDDDDTSAQAEDPLDHDKYYDLEKAEIAATVGSIGRYAFYDCQGLQSVDFKGDKVTSSSLNYLGYGAFSSCALRMIDLSNCPQLTDLGSAIFLRCKSLEIVLLPPNLQGIGTQCFEECDKLTTIHLPKSVQRIGEDAFKYCSQLESLGIPVAAREFGACFLSRCKALKAVQFDSFSSLGGIMGHIKPFVGCNSLHSIQWPAKAFPIALWPYIVHRLFINHNLPSIFGETQEKNGISCLFSSLCEHCDEILQH